MKSTRFVSVVIPVYNNSELLRKCLTALANQTYSQEQYEIIVVDNGSQEDIKSVISDFQQAKLTYESKPGSYAARNQGFSVAKGEIIAFTDSDCIPAPDWIEKGVQNLLDDENCGLVGGRIEKIFKREDPSALEFYDSFFLNQKKYILAEKFGATANLFTRAKVLEDVGKFNPALKSNGDREWGNRVFASGYNLKYADDLVVRHPTRDSWSQIAKKSRRIIGGKYDLEKEPNYIADAIWLLKPPVRMIANRWADKRLKNGQKLVFVLVVLFANYVGAFETIRLWLGFSSQRE